MMLNRWLAPARRARVLQVIVLAVICAGCSYENTAQPTASDPVLSAEAPRSAAAAESQPAVVNPSDAASVPAASAPTGAPVPAAPAVETPPANRNPMPAANPPAAVSPSTHGVELSLPVALAQTLPGGTAMGFSVNYRFLQGGPQPGWQYAVVVQAADGRRDARELPSGPQGTLQWFVDWKPGDGPFQGQAIGRAPDGTVHPLSDVITFSE